MACLTERETNNDIGKAQKLLNEVRKAVGKCDSLGTVEYQIQLLHEIVIDFTDTAREGFKHE